MKTNLFLSQKVYSARALGVLVLVLGCLWIIFSTLGIRLDLTQEKFFTLSEGSKNLVNKLPEDVSLKLYFSSSVRNLPVPIKAYAARVEDLLRQYVSASRGKISLEILDPRPDTDADNWARRYGLKPVPVIDGAELFFGLAVFAGKKEAVIPYIDPRREQFLEYDISEALQKLVSKDRPVVGLISSIEMVAKKPTYDMQSILQGNGDWVLVNELRKIADVEDIASDAGSLPDGIKILIVHHPKNLGDNILRAIDQFVLKGGKLIALVDPFSRVDLDKQVQSGNTSNISVHSDLKTLFSAWDIEFDSSKLVGDLKHPTQITAGGTALTYPFFIQVPEKGINKEAKITGQLKQLLFGEAGSVSLRSGSLHTFDRLITTSTSAGTVGIDTINMGPDAAARKLSSENREYTLAGMLRGKLKSAFTAPSGKADWLTQSKSESFVIVVGDADFPADQNSVQKIPFANQIVAKPINDNLNFLINAVDFFSGSEDLIAIRSRGRFTRPFEKLVDIQEKAQAKWKSEEDSIQKKLNETQANLREMQGARIEANKIVLTPEQQNAIERFRVEEAQMQTRLREVRRNLREDIESLGRILAIVNLAVVPIGVTLAGGVVFRRRARIIGKKNKD
jgi:ABC-type uncharacterized transport system involved in gliding motility auxiliary subunit